MEENKNKITEEEVQVFNEASGNKRKDYLLPASIVAAGVLIAGAVVFAIIYKSKPSAGEPSAQQPSAAAVADIMKVGGRDIVLGDANAPVTLVEYLDYQCPFCGKFFLETQRLIVNDYVNSGKARIVFRNFPFLGPESFAAAQAAECAEDQNQAVAYHDALFKAKYAEETGGGSENDGSMRKSFFIKLAQQLNLDVPAFTSCIDSAKYAGQVDQEKAAGVSAGVKSTPTFFVNGQLIEGAYPYAYFKAGIDALLKGK